MCGSGSNSSGYIQFLEPEGTGGLESVYALSMTGLPSSTTDPISNPLPLIPAITYHLGDLNRSSGIFQWDKGLLSYTWQMFFVSLDNPEVWISVNSTSISSFWPQIYNYNEWQTNGSWVFAGKKHIKDNNGHHNVPDGGSPLLLLSLGVMILGASQPRNLGKKFYA